MTQAVAQVRHVVDRTGFTNPLLLNVLVTDVDYLQVYADDDLLNEGSEYTVTGIGSPFGVEITIIGADDPDNYLGYESFTALYDPPLDQLANLSSGGGLGRPYELALDQQNRRMQSLGDRTLRAIKMPVNVEGDIVLPTPVDGYTIIWDEDTQQWVWAPQAPQGLSAYDVAVANGFVGDEAAWLASLVSTVPGPAGEDGVVQSIVAGTNITVDVTDPANPVISAEGSDLGAVNVRDFGAVVDGATDDYAAVTAALASGAGEVVIEGGSLGTASTIIVPSGVTLRTVGGKIVPLDDIDVVRLHGASKFYGTIDVTGESGWNSTALLYDGVSEATPGNEFRAGTDNDADVNLIGHLSGSGHGTAIEFRCDAKVVTPTAISKANPASVTAAGHGFSTGDLVYIHGLGGMTQLNGRYFYVTKTGTDTFTLNGENSTSHSTFTSGGYVGLKSWLMSIRLRAAVYGFDKALHINDNGHDSTFITGCRVVMDVTYPLQTMVMYSLKANNRGTNSNDITFKSQSRGQAAQLAVPVIVAGVGNKLDMLQWDWLGGPGGTTAATEITAGSTDNLIVTNLAPSHLVNNSVQANTIHNMFDPRLSEGEGNLYLRGATASGKFHVYDAANATGFHIFRVNGGNRFIIDTANVTHYKDATAGVRHRVTGLTSVKNLDWPDAAGVPGVKVGVPATATSTGVVGTWAADASYFYVCTAANTWKRVAIASW